MQLPTHRNKNPEHAASTRSSINPPPETIAKPPRVPCGIAPSLVDGRAPTCSVVVDVAAISSAATEEPVNSRDAVTRSFLSSCLVSFRFVDWFRLQARASPAVIMLGTSQAKNSKNYYLGQQHCSTQACPGKHNLHFSAEQLIRPQHENILRANGLP